MGGWIELSSNQAVTATATTAAWAQPPMPRSSSSLVQVNGKLYIYGGEHQPRTPISSDVHVFELATNQWSVAPPPSTQPPARVGHAAAAVGGRLYVYGGRLGVSQESATLDDLWSYDTASNEWQQIQQQGDRPPALSYHTMTASGDKIYLFAGCSPKDRLNHLYELDTHTSTWKLLADAKQSNAPTARGGTTLAVVGDKLYVFGGYNGKAELDDQYLFDLKTNQWSSYHTSNNPGARSVTDLVYLSGVGSAGSLFVAFGEHSPSARGHESAGAFRSDVWLLDLASKQWTAVTTDPQVAARGWFNTVAIDDTSVVLFGGLDNDDKRRNDLWKWSTS